MTTRRLQPIETTETEATDVTTLASGLIVEDLPDYSKSITIPDSLLRGGLVVVFRDPSHADLEFMEAELKKGNNLEAMKRFACRICTQWGEASGISPSQWDKLRGVASAALMEALDGYFPARTANGRAVL
jgi:hypothetical protein